MFEERDDGVTGLRGYVKNRNPEPRSPVIPSPDHAC